MHFVATVAPLTKKARFLRKLCALTEALGDELLKYICRVCDGELVKAEINGISDMAIDQMGSYC